MSAIDNALKCIGDVPMQVRDIPTWIIAAGLCAAVKIDI
jgi:hypothetical protein